MTLDDALQIIADQTAEIEYLKAELAARASDLEVTMIQKRFRVWPQQALLLAELRRAYPKAIPAWVLLDTLPSYTRDETKGDIFIRVQVSHIRKKLGRDVIDHIGKAGYRLGDAWVERLAA